MLHAMQRAYTINAIYERRIFSEYLGKYEATIIYQFQIQEPANSSTEYTI